LYLAKAMSALETTLRVNSENQTLILAGEPVPRRPLTLVATPVAAPMLIVQSGFQELGTEFTASPQNLVLSSRFADRGSTYNAVSAYTRTQQLSVASARSAIIDTYA
jgi:hypothetical protein